MDDTNRYDEKRPGRIVRGATAAPERRAAASGRAPKNDIRRLTLDLVGGVPRLPQPSLERHVALVLKRLFDLVLALLGLVALAPLLIAVAIAVRSTSPGPALIVQTRTGFAGRSFRLLKFRSMYNDRGDASGIAQVRPGDDRVTPLGRFLRRTSIDELPQLINVILGDMSLIGPRPHAVNMLVAGVRYDELVPWYGLRYTMRPGISGWAQANGLRGPANDPDLARARIEHDLAYIQNFSLRLDLLIIWMTLRDEFITGSSI